MSQSVHSYTAKLINGEEKDFSSYKDKVLLIVNTASECGFTPQYEGLESLYNEFKDSGLEILGFPCNQFGKQEPGENSDIANFCTTRFSVTFPLFEKVEVNGKDTHPLFQHLKEKAPGILGSQSIKWNFTKFLVNQNGDVIKRFAPKDKPESIALSIKQLLG